MDDAWMRDKRPSNCPITLELHDFYLQTSHCSLLVPEGDCCSASKPENAKEDVFIDLTYPITYMQEVISSRVIDVNKGCGNLTVRSSVKRTMPIDKKESKSNTKSTCTKPPQPMNFDIDLKKFKTHNTLEPLKPTFTHVKEKKQKPAPKKTLKIHLSKAEA